MSCSQQVTRKIDHLLEKKPSYIDFTLLPYWVSFIGLSHDFGQKLEILSLFVSGQNMP